MTATNNRMFERLDEIGYFHLNKFHKLSLQICLIWKYLHSMPNFVWISTKLDDITLYHYEKIEYIETNCKWKNHDDDGPPVTSQEDGAIQDGECFEFGRAFIKWKSTFEKKRMVPLVYLIYLLNIYVKRKWMFFGFTCPSRLWKGEFVSQSRASLVVDHVSYS